MGMLFCLFLVMHCLYPRALAASTGAAKSPPAAEANRCELPCSISLNGTWQFLPGRLAGNGHYDPAQDGAAHWQTIQVPSNWYQEGFDISGAAWFKREFVAPSDALGALAVLRFKGVDYFADVWLNGKYLGSHEGYFAPFSFDVSAAIKPGEKNLLVVRVDSPNEDPAAWSLHKRLIKGIFSHHDTRPGGAWSARGQEKNTGGIWNDVSIGFSYGARIDHMRARTHLDQQAQMHGVSFRVATHSAWQGEEQVQADIDIAPFNFDGEALHERRDIALAPGNGELVLTATVPGGRLWWPIGLGNPCLYRATIALSRNGHVIDRMDVVFGLREVALDENTQTWRINGRRVFLRGTNYIPTQWLSEMTPERYQRDVGLMLAANINAVRVHAHVGDERFYQACDEAGLLVWQDFPLQWGYEDSAEFHAEAARQVDEMIRMLDSHPSILAWSMHNEPPWDAWWMKFKYPDYDPEQNRKLDELLARTARANDPSRHVHMASATHEHQWQGWYSGQWTDFAKPETRQLITEFGAQALPGIASLRQIFSENDLFPDTPEKMAKWEYHNFQPNETFKNAKISMGKNISEFIANSQSYQARLLQLAAESLRRQKYKPVNAIFQFMFVENWPSLNWGVVDYWRHPKPGYDALRRAYQPVLPSIEWSRDRYQRGAAPRLGLWIVNDTTVPLTNVTYAWTLSRGDAAVTAGRLQANAEADSSVHVGNISLRPLAVGKYRLQTRVIASDGTPLGDNAYEFTVE